MKFNKKSLKNLMYVAGFTLAGIVSSYGQEPKPMEQIPGKNPYSVEITDDFNNDGFDDILSFSSSTNNFNQKGTLYIKLNNKKGNFDEPREIASINNVYEKGIQILSGKFNNDQNKDIYLKLVKKGEGINKYYFQGDGKGNFENKTSFENNETYANSN